MKNIKDELQHIIFGNESTGQTSQLKKVQCFLKSNEETGSNIKKQQRVKSKEAAALLTFAAQEGLLYSGEILETDFISEGAEQRVYRFDGLHVIKTNAGAFYESWFDYFNSLLIHNYFFPATAYSFLGFKVIAGELNAVVKQEFIVTTETTNLSAVKDFFSIQWISKPTQ